MKKTLRIGLWTLLALAIVAAGAATFQRQISEALFERAITSNLTNTPLAALEDGLHLFLCGSGAPLADPGRAGPCIGVLAGDRAFVIDAGAGATRNLSRAGFPLGRIEQVLLTHLHSDHFDGLGELMLQAWIGGSRLKPLNISGPRGVNQVVEGFNSAYAVDAKFRTAHHGEAVAAPGGFGGTARMIEAPAPGRMGGVLETGDLTIRAIPVSHRPVEPAFGYRIDYKGRSAVISGDTRHHPGLATAAVGADVILHEALQPALTGAIGAAAADAGRNHVAAIMEDIVDYHTAPEDAARLAQQAGARQLVLYHILPPLPSRLLHGAFLQDARQHFDGDLIIAFDGLLISLPAASSEIRRSAVL